MSPRHISAFFALVALTISSPLLLSAQGFSDVGTSTPYKEAIESLQDRGVVEGYAGNMFKAGNTIQRDEFLKIVMEGREEDFSFTGSDCFPDISADDWSSKYICKAKAEGIVSGYPQDGLFHPERPINFVEAGKILSLAFGQNINQYSPDWYEPYARALESSKAIPPSIETLDAPITRGEMAEMIWRLTENITDEEAKGYLNVKYPDVSINLATNTLQTAKTCADLRAFTEEAGRSGGGGIMPMMRGAVEDVAMPIMAPSVASGERSAGGAKGYSQTNVQVEGVDEADIVKTDGTYLYVVQNQNVRIIQAHPASSMKLMSTIDLADASFSPQDLYIDRDRLIVIGSKWESGPVIMENEKRLMAPGTMIWPGPYYPPKAEVRIFDVSDRSNPTLERKVGLEGSMVSTRKIRDRLYLVVNQPYRFDLPMPLLKNATEEDLLPRFEDSKKGTEMMPVSRCADVIIMPRVPSPQYLTVAVLETDNPNADVKREVVLGNATNVYASLENLYIASTEWIYHWEKVGEESEEKTNLYRFAFMGDGIDLEAQGSVPGHILNQFSMDENGTTFRIATTTTPLRNNLFILNKNLERVGAIEDIAPGEMIYSVRFLGDRAYMVTFRTIDPLFVIDTSDPRNPTILGKLKIPGYSDYLHPYDENHILGFGKEAVESKDGNFAWYQGMKIALFDVSDVERPLELHKTMIGDRGTDSPLLYNHKALLFDKERNLLAFPVTVAQISDAQKEGEPGSAWGTTVFQGVYVYDLTLKDGFGLRGKITHYDEDTLQKTGDAWYGYGKNIERVLRIDNSLLAISSASITNSALQTLLLQKRLDLPQE
jgi:uncharacterized secreted protein with C-terminal beta-propeller domain